MAKDAQFFEDLLKLAGSAANVVLHSASDAKKQWDGLVDRVFDDLLSRKSLVTREEFDVLQQAVERLQQENADLKKQLEQ